MGYLKFTNFKTGKVYDSRKPIGRQKHVHSNFNEATNNEPNQNSVSYETIYRYPNGKEFWIDDQELAEVLECEVEEIPCVLNRLMDNL